MHLNSLKYGSNGKPPRVVPTDICRCIPVEEGGNGCDENCLNRMMYIECFGGEPNEKVRRGGGWGGWDFASVCGGGVV